MLLGADLARRLDLRIEWPGPTISSTTASKWQPVAANVAEAHCETVSQKRMTELLKKFASVFVPPAAEPASVPFRHIIRLEEGAKPFRSPPYRMTAEQLTDLKGEVETYLDKGWV